MVNNFRPLIEVLRELQKLAQKKASGYFFIATEGNQSSTVLLRNGRIDEVTFSRYRNDDAVRQLANVSTARASFQPSAVGEGAGKTLLSETALQWLLGGFESHAGAQRQAAPDQSRSVSPNADPLAQRKVIEKVALGFLGPIAALICDEAFSSASDLEEVLQEIGKNLATPDEFKQFLAEARAALAAK
ncbi:hypothetical protein [Dyella acidiphila]|uniref:DUF8082 domain-containing protein n=1 Tax=Dyella acidiphila TaxID=2775866 RepID=A0ABR9GER0_9GAMM|nr:hypothetical protein [Dyella acidiphila]MBE1162542.1 hypothetical protein [Dyella acidiphila]